MKKEHKQKKKKKKKPKTTTKQEWWREKRKDKKQKIEWQINFLIIIYTVLQIYNVYGEGYLRRNRRGNWHHYSVRDYNQSS